MRHGRPSRHSTFANFLGPDLGPAAWQPASRHVRDASSLAGDRSAEPVRGDHSGAMSMRLFLDRWDRHSACHGLLAIMLWFGAISPGRAATFGTVVMIDGGVSDLVLDETRNRLYLVNSPQNRIEIYDISKRQLLSPVATSGQPLSAALSLDAQSLYVTDYGASTLDIINLGSLMTISRVSLSSAPE